MRHGSRPLALALSAALLLGAAPSAEPAATSEVTVLATGLRSSTGVVRACMTGDMATFPRCQTAGAAYKAVGEAGASVTLHFTGVKPGRYAIALLHDENANGKADRAAMMIPKEGFGFSRDAKVRFGPPKFRDAAFDIAPGAQEKLTIRMRYLL